MVSITFPTCCVHGEPLARSRLFLCCFHQRNIGRVEGRTACKRGVKQLRGMEKWTRFDLLRSPRKEKFPSQSKARDVERAACAGFSLLEDARSSAVSEELHHTSAGPLFPGVCSGANDIRMSGGFVSLCRRKHVSLDPSKERDNQIKYGCKDGTQGITRAS